MNPSPRINQSVKDMYDYRHRPENMRAFADLYWRTLLYLASIVTFFVIGFGIFELSSVFKDIGSGAGAGGSAQPIPTLNREQLRDTLEGFEARAVRFESLKTSAPVFTDPSK